MAKTKKQVVVRVQPARVNSKKKKKNASVSQAEVTRLGGALRMLGGLGGRFAGGLLGMGDAGAAAGTGLGAAISRWLGSGDYVVKENSIVQRASTGVPMMHKTDQTVVLRHREYLGEVRSSTAFTVQNAFAINPGLRETFPWASGIASQFTQYRIRGMVYHYVPTSGNAVSSTNPALGSVMLQTSYRADDNAPTSKVETLNEYWACEARPDVEFCHPIECDPKENPFGVHYVRTGSVSSSSNILMYDIGQTWLCTSGMQTDGSVVGDLWVTYEIELKKPILADYTGTSLRGATWRKSGSEFSLPTLWRNAFPELPIIDSFSSAFAAVLPRGSVGTYMLNVCVFGATSFSFNTFNVTSATKVPLFAPSVTDNAVNITSGSNGIIQACFTVTDPSAAPRFLLSWNQTGATSFTASIVEVNPLLSF